MARLRRTVLVTLSCWMLGLGAAQAATCTIATTGVAFGAYDVFTATATDSTGTITFRCTGTGNSPGNRISVTIGLSRGSGGSYGQRSMNGPLDALGYNIYRDAARTIVWGDSTAGTQVYANTNVPRSRNITLTMYGRVPPQQDVRAGAYTDTITATINF